MPASHDLDERLKQYWLQGGDKQQAGVIVEQALTSEVRSAKQARLALQVMREYEAQLSPRLQGLIAKFRDDLDLLCRRLAQVDAIGNADTEPTAALFEVLGEASEGIELSGFDPAKLHQARVAAPNRADAAAALLEAFGWERLPPEVAAELRRAVEDLADDQRHFQSFGLFVADEQGFVLGLQVRPTDSGAYHCASQVNEAMRQQAEYALREALTAQGADWGVQWPLTYEGESIGLGLYVAALVAKQQLPFDALTAATGRIDVNGHIRGVGGITAKLEAARESGIRRVVLSAENREDAEAAPASTDLELIVVDRASEVRAKLLNTSSGRAELGFEGAVRLVRNLIPQYGLAVDDAQSVQHGYRFDVSDGRSSAILTVYSGRRGSVVVGGPQGSARQAAELLVADYFQSEKPTAQPTLTYQVPRARQPQVKRLLLDLGAAKLEPTSEYEQWRLRLSHGASNATVVLYTSNKCVLQGQSPAHADAAAAIERALEGLGGVGGGGDGQAGGAERATATRTAVAPPELPDVPHIGTDESGKGDYFGPLVSAAVFVTPQLAAELKAMGVRDSKRMTDKSVRTMAPKLKQLLRNRYSITTIGPRRYNELYAQMRSEGKNLNTLLAWGHARSLEDLLGKGVKPEFAVVDQFADARYIEQRIMADTRESGIEIKQFPKAEADIAVAAASVLAREAFLEWLERESARTKVTLPKGASPQVIAAGREIVARYGRERLSELAKMSFKTTEKVLAA
jgi:ribonuclease HIII